MTPYIRDEQKLLIAISADYFTQKSHCACIEYFSHYLQLIEEYKNDWTLPHEYFLFNLSILCSNHVIYSKRELFIYYIVFKIPVSYTRCLVKMTFMLL